MSDSEEFKSYGRRSQQVDLLDDKVAQPRPTAASQNLLFACYTQNSQRKQALLNRITQVQALRRQKAIAQQLLINRQKKIMIAQIYDDDQQIQLPDEFLKLEKDYEEKRQALLKLESKYAVCQNISARRFVEMEMNRMKALLRGSCQVSKYLYLEAEEVVAVLYKGGIGSRVGFISVGIPAGRLQQIKLDHNGKDLVYAHGILAVVFQKYFILYNFQAQKMELQSTQHESEIVFVGFYQKQKTLFVVSATKEGAVRLYDTSEKVLKSLIICEYGENYALHGDKLLYSVGNKLMQVNIFTKEFKDIKTLDNPIIFLSNDTLTTKGYTLNQYFAKQTFDDSKKTEDRVIIIDGKQGTVKESKGETTINYAKESFTGSGKYICSFTRKKQQQSTELILLFGTADGQLSQRLIPTIPNSSI